MKRVVLRAGSVLLTRKRRGVWWKRVVKRQPSIRSLFCACAFHRLWRSTRDGLRERVGCGAYQATIRAGNVHCPDDGSPHPTPPIVSDRPAVMYARVRASHTPMVRKGCAASRRVTVHAVQPDAPSVRVDVTGTHTPVKLPT